MALGVGDCPGRVIEIFGPESSGKTTVALHAIAERRPREGWRPLLTQARLGSFVCQRLGVDINNLLVAQPDSGEQALEIAEALVRSGAIDVIVIDSVAALVPEQNWMGKWVMCM